MVLWRVSYAHSYSVTVFVIVKLFNQYYMPLGDSVNYPVPDKELIFCLN